MFKDILSTPAKLKLFRPFLAQQVELAPLGVRRRLARSKVARDLFLMGAVVAFARAGGV